VSIEETKAVARRFYEEVFNGKNPDAIDELFAATYVAHPPSGLGPVLDPEGMKQFACMFLTAFPDFYLTFDDEIAEGDKAILRLTAAGTHLGEFMGIPPTGRQATWTGISIARVAGGKIMEHWGEQDILGLLQQLGVIPTAAPAVESAGIA
jgi:predicted ester cyclase